MRSFSTATEPCSIKYPLSASKYEFVRSLGTKPIRISLLVASSMKQAALALASLLKPAMVAAVDLDQLIVTFTPKVGLIEASAVLA